MEDLNVQDVLAGLKNVLFIEHHITLLQLLSNMVCEDAVANDEAQVRTIITFTMQKITAALGAQHQEAQHQEETLDLCLTVLSNLTVLEKNSQIFLEVVEAFAEPFRRVLLSYFNSDNITQILVEGNEISFDPFQKALFIVCNITRLEAGRALVLRRSSNYIPLILSEVSLH